MYFSYICQYQSSKLNWKIFATYSQGKVLQWYKLLFEILTILCNLSKAQPIPRVFRHVSWSFVSCLATSLRQTRAFFVTYNWIMYSAEAAHEDMVLIHAFVLHISVEFGTQNNYCTILYIINERLALSETANWDKEWANGKKYIVRKNTVEGGMWTREYHIAPSKPEAVTPLNDLLDRNIFACNFYHWELTVHS